MNFTAYYDDNYDGKDDDDASGNDCSQEGQRTPLPG